MAERQGGPERVEVSVVMPVYNEAGYIEAAIESLLTQDYPREKMEWLFVDGRSTDETRALIEAYGERLEEEHPKLIRLLDNPKRTVPYAMNAGIRASRGRYIVRLDAHADYPPDYISACIEELEARPEVDNVGGFATTRGRGRRGETIARMLSSRFGVGDSQFRTEGQAGYVDTVPFGAFRREVFTKVGGFDIRLTRNQDNEMNDRIRRGGGRIWLSERIRLTYWCRDTVRGICRMARQNGRWNVLTMRLRPGSMGLRHFVPFIFLLSLIGLPLLGGLLMLLGQQTAALVVFALLGLELALYFILDLIFSIRAAGGEWRRVPLLLALFPLFHLNYGWGSLMGILALPRLDTGMPKSVAAPRI